MDRRIKWLSEHVTEISVIGTLISVLVLVACDWYALWSVAQPSEDELFGELLEVVLALLAFFGAMTSLIVVTLCSRAFLGPLYDLKAYLFIGCLVCVASSAYFLLTNPIAKLHQHWPSRISLPSKGQQNP